MAVPGLKDFNRLIDSAQSEIEAWSRTPAAAAVPASSLIYARDVLAAIENSVSIGSLAAGFRNVLSTVPDVREALAIVDSVVTRHGFQRTHDYPNQEEHGFIRRYSLSVASDRPLIACHIELTATGMEVRFGEFGVWISSPEARGAAADVRAALIEKYGESRVR